MRSLEKANTSIPWLTAGFLASLICYHLLLYQTSRIDFFSILLYFSLLGLAYLMVLRKSTSISLNLLLIGAVILRLSLIGAVPELSDDFYRFIWDGRLWHSGVHPFAFLPSELMQNPEFSSDPLNQQLFTGLNSPDYFTIYPPVSQFVFILSTSWFPDSIMGNLVTMRSIILLSEIGTIFMLPRVLALFKIPSRHALIYAWNPLVIVELTGNLHFEAIMIFFLLLAVWCFKTGRWFWSAFVLGLAISTKLVPLIFLPLLWRRLPLKRLTLYYLVSGLTVLFCFLPLLNSELIQGMSSSLSLYFQKFEFNASIYYIVREIGFAIKGFNVIQTAGKYLALTTFISILLLSWRSAKKITWPQAMLWSLLIYLLLTTTVHPWYITPLVLLSCFSKFRFPIVWSTVVVLSYAGYSDSGYSENLWFVAAEYTAVLLFIWLELKGYLANLFDIKTVTIK